MGNRFPSEDVPSSATIRDVAELAGVSVASVSRYLNKKGYVGQETAARIEAAIQALKFEPNVVARNLARGRSGMIAILVSDLENPFFTLLLKAVTEEAAREGYGVLVWTCGQRKGRTLADLARRRFVDGLIVAAHGISQEELRVLERHGIPMVMLDRAPSYSKSVALRVRDRQGARKAVRHLWEQGYRTIAHVTGPLGYVPARERLGGYMEGLLEVGAEHGPIFVESDFTFRGGMAAARRLFLEHPEVDAVFAANDLMALGILKFAVRQGRRVPEDVGIVGYDGIPLTEMSEPELSTVAQPIEQLGQKAVTVVLSLLEDPRREPREVWFDVTLVARSSSRRREDA
ncbi:LacI family transcriptional regulator [Brockia lithotrophica]|uniref:LacI family transcriptional regulator n=1 Tax=Brockia lithotrophica TaxID=933949 RepID=A0A660KW39_9BACL|nr:LacI family transcriptional regulator [Brockia lithotrophica]